MSILGLRYQKKVADFVEGAELNMLYRHGKNLFNKNAVSTGYLTSTGSINGNSDFRISDFIPVFKGMKLKFSTAVSNPSIHIWFYDESKNIIPGSGISYTTLVENGRIVEAKGAYMRASLVATDSDVLQIEYGEVTTDYEPFDATPSLPNFRYAQDVNILNGGFTLNGSRNLFDKDSVVPGKYLRTGGNVLSSEAYAHSDYIDVIPGMEIITNIYDDSITAAIVFYDSNNSVVYSISLSDLKDQRGIIKIPNDAVKMRATYRQELQPAESIQIEYGIKRTPYVPHSSYASIPNFQSPQEVFIRENYPKGFVSNEKYLFGKVTGETNYIKIMAVYNNHVIYTLDNRTMYYTDKGVQDDYFISRAEAVKAINVRNEIIGFDQTAVILEAALIKTQEHGMKTLLLTDKNQIFYSNDGIFDDFQPANIWALPGDEHKHHSVGAEDLDPSGTRYRFYQPADIALRNQMFLGFNTKLWYVIQGNGGISHESLIFANYQVGLAGEYVPSCVFQTANAKDIYVQYMFGIPTPKVKKAGTSTYISHVDINGRGENLDTSAIVSDYVSGLTLNKRVNIVPSAAESDPTDIFEISAPITITAISKANPAVITVSDATGLSLRDVFFIAGDATDAEWNAIRNTTASATSGGNGRFFIIRAISGNNLTIAEAWGNPHNNLVPRHIHALNFFANGIAISTGEAYPGSFIIFNRINWDVNSPKWRENVLLTTSENSLVRSVGIHLTSDNKIVYASDEERVEVEVDALTVRGSKLKTSANGVWKGEITDMDNMGKYKNVLWNIDHCYQFAHLGGSVLFVSTHSGKTFISFDEGDTWEHITTDGINKSRVIGFDKNQKRWYFGSGRDNTRFIELK